MTWQRRRDKWASERAKSALDGAPERRRRFSTISDVEVDRLYGPWSWSPESGAEDESHAENGGSGDEGRGGGGPTAVDHRGDPLRRQPGRWDEFDPLRDIGF